MPGEQLETDCEVYELPRSNCPARDDSSNIIVSRALLARIEVLEAENKQLKIHTKRKEAFLHTGY